MNKKFIWAIIIIMSLALIGIAVTQFVWIKAQVDLDEKNFDNKVTMAMNSVKAQLVKDTEEQESVGEHLKMLKKKSFGKDLGSLSRGLSTKTNGFDPTMYQIAGMVSVLNPEQHLASINKEKLDVYLKTELIDQGIDIKYDYGVYSNSDESFIIRNGKFAVPFAGNENKTQNTKGLENSKYKVNLFTVDETGSPGYLQLFFPSKQSFLWSRVLPSMLTSILFTGLVLFCFAYTIFVIFRQKKVSEMKTDFINNMTHEFKTPIATISLATDSITNNTVISNEEKIKRFAGIIKQENKRMLNQVEKVLQMARIDKKDFELKVTDVNINDVIYQAAENSRLKVIQRNGKLETNLKADNPNIQGDLTHLSNIVNNLLDNAEKYSNGEPEIIVESRNTPEGVEISVKDNGIGMTKESQKHIFDKFYRVHTGNRHDVKGFGLGLSYVKALVNAHNGTIKVNSELGQGSTFTLFLPFTHSD